MCEMKTPTRVKWGWSNKCFLVFCMIYSWTAWCPRHGSVNFVVYVNEGFRRKLYTICILFSPFFNLNSKRFVTDLRGGRTDGRTDQKVERERREGGARR